MLTLPDGRRLSYLAAGARDGYPVIYCHGFPSSRFEALNFDQAARRRGITLIAADRPGYGQSGFLEQRTLRAWAKDVAALADALGLERFSVMGVSGGAPYALACALDMPERVERLALVGGIGPMDAPGATEGMGRVPASFVACARRWPHLATFAYARLAGPVMYRFPRLVTRLLSSAAPDADRAVIDSPWQRRLQWASYREAFRQGGRGAAWDLRLYTQPWELDPGHLSVPSFLWHGEADRTVPAAMGRAYAVQIPHCRARFLPGEGHFSLTANHAGGILADLPGGAGT